MPWHREAMKDAADCDKRRGAVNKHRSGDFRMGKPTTHVVPADEFNSPHGATLREVKHLST